MSQEYKTELIPMSEILADAEFNCRGTIIPFDVLDLVSDIKKRGLQVPITVQPRINGKYKYRIVMGHRRHMAFRVLERTEIPAIIQNDLSDLDASVLNLTENIKRCELNMLQEAKGLAPFKKAKWTEPQIATELCMSRGWVQVRLMLLELPEDIQNEAAVGNLNQEQIRKLFTIRAAKDEMYAMVRMIKERKARGESTKIVVPKKPNPYRKDERTNEEIFTFQDIIQRTIGNNFTTVMLGWAAGVNNDYEAHRALREEAQKKGIVYEIPVELLEKL